MILTIREERATDIREVSELIKLAFKNEDAASLAGMLRYRKDFIRDLSMVAEVNGILTGYVLLSPVQIQTEEGLTETLWLEPMCVHPTFQGRGIGTSLLKRALYRAKLLQFESVVVTGSYSYYSRFGFEQAEKFGIKSSVSIKPDGFLAMELKRGGLSKRGKLIFPQEIFD